MGVFFLNLALLLAAVAIAQVPDLNSLQWKNRVLLLFAPEPSNNQLDRQEGKLKTEQQGLDERDMKVFEITGHSPEAEALRSHFGVKEDQFAIVLVGKDGGCKLKKTEPVEVSSLFAKIDSMPMRRAEMRKSSEHKSGKP